MPRLATNQTGVAAIHRENACVQCTAVCTCTWQRRGILVAFGYGMTRIPLPAPACSDQRGVGATKIWSFIGCLQGGPKRRQNRSDGYFPSFRFTSPVPGPVAERRLRGCCGESSLVGAFDFCRFD